MISALFWDIIQRWVVFLYRRFGTSYRSDLQGSRSPRRTGFLLGLLDPRRWDRYIVPKRRYRITTPRYVISQKGSGLIYIAAGAWNHANPTILWEFGRTLLAVQLLTDHRYLNRTRRAREMWAYKHCLSGTNIAWAVQTRVSYPCPP
jgi:hypothetical protein